MHDYVSSLDTLKLFPESNKIMPKNNNQATYLVINIPFLSCESLYLSTLWLLKKY